MDLLIKGMLCERCISVVREGITRLGYDVAEVTLGKVVLRANLDGDQLGKLFYFIRQHGFEIGATRQARLVENVKIIVKQYYANNSNANRNLKLSRILAENLNMSYGAISLAFAQSEGTTIEKYVMTVRLEKVKRMVASSKKTLTEIAHITGFSSVNHLSRQFKDLTGITPTQFKLQMQFQNGNES